MSSLEKFKEDLLKGEKSELIKRVSKQNKNLRNRFDDEVITKQNLQTNLKEIYKPITDNQQLTTGEQSTKTDTLFQQLLNDLQGKHDGTSRLLSDIIRGLAKTNEQTRQQGLDIVSAIAKQPLLPELINTLNYNYPELVHKIAKSGDLRDLYNEDRKALEPLGQLNDNDLKTLIHYYALKEQIKSGVSEEDLGAVGGPPSYTESQFQENPTYLPIYNETIKILHKRNPGLSGGSRSGSVPVVSPTFYYDASDRDTVKFGNHNVLFKGNNIKIGDKEYILTTGLERLLNRLNPTLDERITNDDLNNYLEISRHAGLDYTKHITIGKKLENVLRKLNKLDELDQNVNVLGNGLKTIILPDNVDELKKRLALLCGEYSAGNNSMFNEINAVLDILLKKRIISKSLLRKILHSIKS